jgi:hypothetical protein
MKRLLLAWISSFVVMFLLGGIFNGIIIRDFVATNVPAEALRTPSNMLFILFGYLLLAFLMATIYPRVFSRPSILSGTLFGAVAGICWLLPYALVLHGVYHLPVATLLIDPAWAVLEQGLGGTLIGLIYAKLR